jgi:hypothetical protein
MLKKCLYTLKAPSTTGLVLDFTPFVISINLNWGLNASKANAKIALAQEGKTLLKKVKRGSVFTLEWGWDKNNFTRVRLYWIGTSWEINANATIELVHKSWELARTPIRGVFNNTSAKIVASKFAAKKGLKIDTSLAQFKGVGSITVNQSAEAELEKQFKGQIITHGLDGVSLKIVDFNNIKDNAQVYYIDTQAGYIGNMTINYKAILPKDKSYIELLGGGVAASEPNNNPTRDKQISTASLTPELPPGNYALLLSTGNKNKLNNPILELKLVVNGKQIGSYPCVSGRSFTQDSSKTNNVLPDGEYIIDSKLVPGSIPEVGGKFLGVTPKFKTSRSALGIHLDPSYNKRNGEDGTNGCIGLITAEDRNAVHRLILENNIRTLIVNLKKSPINSKEQSSSKSATSAYYVGTLNDNRVIAKSNENMSFDSVASLFKLFIADSILKSNINLSETYQNKTINLLLKEMVDVSDNASANKLITRLGGLNSLNAFCKKSGFNSSEIDSLYASNKIGIKKSTAKDLFNGFKDLFIKSDNSYVIVQQFLVGRGLDINSETHTKIGFNSVFNGAVSLIEGQSGIKYIAVILARTEKEKLAIAKSLKNYFV